MRTRGFTIVELVVVIAVVGVLIAISGFAAAQVQRDSRDKDREADIAILQNELEKFYNDNGIYPPGCSENCTNALITSNTATAGRLLNGSATHTTIKTTLPGITAAFSDPKNTAPTTPFANYTAYTGVSFSQRYFYFGGLLNTTTGSLTITNRTPSVSGVVCTLSQTIAPGETSSYVAGYFSEVNNAWILNHGSSARKATLSSGTTTNCRLS